ncbi:unnamed protein product [Mytilus coruscus]|uniref:Uncharacterized protein n=1 Tax=Mytilus coruscus TaxID=42192 RepID=A0A6J8E749_MYTCO|nr:unnamed protein product [Mytilus coruscus]
MDEELRLTMTALPALMQTPPDVRYTFHSPSDSNTGSPSLTTDKPIIYNQGNIIGNDVYFWNGEMCSLVLQANDIPFTDSGPNIIAVDGSRLYAVNRKTSIVTTVAVGLHSANQIDYHRSKSFIYFASSHYGSMHRICYPCHTNERETEVIIPEVSDYHPYSIAIDSDHDHIYWSDHNFNAVIRSELDGSNKTVILDSENVVRIGHIALDVNNR